MRSRITILLLAVSLAAAACGGDATGSSEPTPTELVLVTHDSFAVSDGVLESFTAATGIEVTVLQAGDAGTMVSQAILTKDDPIADVMYGIDNTFLSRALDESLFLPYVSPGLDVVPDDLELDPEHRVTPIDFGDVCVNYDKAAFATSGPPVPATLRDLTDPRYQGMLAVEDPATSSAGLAFLLATIGTFPEGGDYDWLDFWSDLAANDVLVTSGWEEAYYSSFSGGSGEGDRPLVVSYASSPPVEVYYADPPVDEAPTGVLTDGCFRQIEFAGVLAGTAHPEAAGRLVDVLLSDTFQEDMPLTMFVFPASTEATLPPVFADYAVVPDHTATVDPAAIDAHREEWIEQWTDAVR
jgi:thiamine transport system substrate-binding protein